MAQPHTMVHAIGHYGLLAVCILGFLICSLGFLVYRLVLKPLAFAIILITMVPIMINAFRSSPYTDSQEG